MLNEVARDAKQHYQYLGFDLACVYGRVCILSNFCKRMNRWMVDATFGYIKDEQEDGNPDGRRKQLGQGETSDKVEWLK